MMSNFFYSLGNIFESLWSVIPSIGGVPNYIFSIIITLLFVYWTVQLIRFKRNQEN